MKSRNEITLYKDGELLVACMTMKYLHAFVEDHYPLDDSLWVNMNGKYMNYLEVKT